ncbi:MAG TPA: hypothetical protein VIK72_14050 [Clostridiaceae bacterium]
MISESNAISIGNEIQLDDFQSKIDLSDTINSFKCSLVEKYKKRYIIEIIKNIEAYTDWHFSSINSKCLILSREDLSKYKIYLESVRKYKKDTILCKMIALHKLSKFINKLNHPDSSEHCNIHPKKKNRHYNYLTKEYIRL